jgi:hypothetical protein
MNNRIEESIHADRVGNDLDTSVARRPIWDAWSWPVPEGLPKAGTCSDDPRQAPDSRPQVLATRKINIYDSFTNFLGQFYGA